jgi:type II secretory pathway pseudopilin PulG
MQNKKSKKGFLIVEALLSITIIMMTIATAVFLVVYGYSAVSYNKNSLVAGMLALECKESLRGLRDTNWIRFSYDKEKCWNSNSDTCPAVNYFATPTSYRLELNYISAPYFSVPGHKTSLDLSDGIDATDDFYQLNFLDSDALFDSNNDGDSANDEDVYTTAAGTGESKFYRMMVIDSINPAVPPITEINARCVVAWMEGNDPKKIDLPIVLTNY